MPNRRHNSSLTRPPASSVAPPPGPRYRGPMSRPAPTRRQQLIEARDRVRRQIEILRNPSRGRDFTPLSRELIANLKGVLSGLEQTLRELGAGDG